MLECNEPHSLASRSYSSRGEVGEETWYSEGNRIGDSSRNHRGKASEDISQFRTSYGVWNSVSSITLDQGRFRGKAG